MGVSPDQQRLFKRMTTLALCRGMLIGSALSVIGLNFVNIWANRAGTPLLAAPLAELLAPLILILLGGMIVVMGQEQALSRRLAGFWYPAAGAASSLQTTALLVFGWFFIGWSSLWLVTVLLHLDMGVALLYPFFAGLLCCVGVILYLQSRGNRRAGQP